MKTYRNCRNSLQRACSKIHLIDKCLMIIMFLLLLQSSYILFFETASSAELSTIDVIIRTATASIFGYFLSSNFIRHESGEAIKKNDSSEAATIESDSSIGFKNKMELSEQNSEKNMKSGKINIAFQGDNPDEQNTNNHLQIIITTVIAVFCLVVLTVIRNISGSGAVHLTASAQATISQFRDIVSGCIGFLIGVPTTKK